MLTLTQSRLRGFFDLISPRSIGGWAVDENDLDRQIEVSVFLDGQKIEQLKCDVVRPDLIEAGTFGTKGHGFSLPMNPPLTPDRPRRFTVRFTETGRLLNNGDRMYPEDAAPNVPDFKSNLPNAFPLLPAPRIPRDWFDRLAMFEPDKGLFNLVAQCDLDGVSQPQVAYSVFGNSLRPAELLGRMVNGAWNQGVARDTAYDMLVSETFQREILQRFIDAYPEKNRLVFIHIPKCAGTDLSAHLEARLPNIHHSFTREGYASKSRLFQVLRDNVRLLPYFESILVHGHLKLGECLHHGILRPHDKVFTILRDPIDIALSQVNYILTRLMQDAESGVLRPDSREWLDKLQLSIGVELLNKSMLDGLRLRILRDQVLVEPNIMCNWLGGGTAEAVMDRLASVNAEVTTTRNYRAWLKDRWTLESTTRMNESVKFLTKDELSAADLRYLRRNSAEDIKLYEAMEARIAAAGTSSIHCGEA